MTKLSYDFIIIIIYIVFCNYQNNENYRHDIFKKNVCHSFGFFTEIHYK